MGAKQFELLKYATKTFGKIKPCASMKRWKECFTLYKGRLHFWFNTIDKSTHVLSEDDIGEVEQKMLDNKLRYGVQLF